jgi:hypothetical protein
MPELVRGSDIIYSLVSVKQDDISLVKESNRHEVCGYIVFEDEYKFYSVEDKYTNPILNHWSADIVKNYDNETSWFLIKEHPCRLYRIITDIYKGNYVCNVYNFDIWTSNALVAVITDVEID